MISDIDAAKSAYPGRVISVADHGNTSADPMTNNFSLAFTNAYQIQGYPDVMVDRADWSAETGDTVTPQLFTVYADHANHTLDAASMRLCVPSPVNIDITSMYDSATRVAQVTVTANFVDTVSGDMRITCLLVEDTVIGSSSYAQTNYEGVFCGDPNASCEFYYYPCGIPTTLTGQYVFYHKNVLRYNMTPTFGTAALIFSSVSAGQHFSKTYPYTIPSAWNAANMKVVAFVGFYNTAKHLGGEVLNAQEVVLGQTIIAAVADISPAIDNASLEAAYPNPFSQITNIKVNVPASQHIALKVYNLLGSEIAVLTDENLSPGMHMFYWDGKNKNGSSLPNGLYLIRLQTEKQSLSKSVVLSRN
jgi:hypothetical protein